MDYLAVITWGIVAIAFIAMVTISNFMYNYKRETERKWNKYVESLSVEDAYYARHGYKR